MIYPVIEGLTGKKIEWSAVFPQGQYNDTSYLSVAKELSSSTNAEVEKVYSQAIEADIKAKLEARGYQVNNIALEIETKDENKYGAIKRDDIERNIFKCRINL